VAAQPIAEELAYKLAALWVKGSLLRHYKSGQAPNCHSFQDAPSRDNLQSWPLKEVKLRKVHHPKVYQRTSGGKSEEPSG
jgi:hypothetical protein